MEIKRINLHKLKNAEHFQFHFEFRDLFIKEFSQTSELMKPFEAIYLPAFENVDESFAKIMKSQYTPLIKEADNIRDDIYLGMVQINRGNLRSINPDIKDAAKRLKIVFDTFKSANTQSIYTQTTGLSTVTDLLLGKYKEDAAAVGIDKWAADLKKQNEKFSMLVNKRDNESVARTSIVLKDARKELDSAYRTICGVIKAFSQMEGLTFYKRFIKTMNAIVTQYKK